MKRLRSALEDLHSDLEQLGEQQKVKQTEFERELAKQAEGLKVSRAREANAMALAQKIATKIDYTIERVERLLANDATQRAKDKDYA